MRWRFGCALVCGWWLISGGPHLTIRPLFANGGGPTTKRSLHQPGVLRAKPFLRLQAHGRFGKTIAMHPSGAFFATGGTDGWLRLWDRDGRRLKALSLKGEKVDGLVFSTQGDRMAACTREGRVWIWDVSQEAQHWRVRWLRAWQATGKIRRAYGRSGLAQLNAVAFQPGGRLLATGSESGRLDLWEPQTGQRLATLRDHREEIRALSFHPNGRWLASAGGGFSGRDFVIRVWDVSQRTVVQRLKGHQRWLYVLGFSPDGRHLLSGGHRGQAWVWSTQSWKRIRVYRHAYNVLAVAFHPMKPWQVATGTYPMMHVWDLQSGRALMYGRGFRNDVTGIVYTPDGSALFAIDENGLVLGWRSPR